MKLQSKLSKKKSKHLVNEETAAPVARNKEEASKGWSHCSSSHIGSKRKATSKTKKLKGARNCQKLDTDLPISAKVSENEKSDGAVEVAQVSGVMEDSSRGMKKWLMKYRQSRPGLKTLQMKIDNFIIAHEAQLEKERKEKEAQAAEDGWTVVIHHKGRKKTTDSESGVTMGSVAPAAVIDKLAKKKNQGPAQDFYRFQRREAQRNEVMMLQSKFEQDRKRIQKLRAARKFQPY